MVPEFLKLTTSWWRALALAAVAALVLGACAAEEEEEVAVDEVEIDGPVRIGALLPMTGDLQAYGESTLNSIRLAVQEINAQGGIHGQEVQLRTGDTQTTAQAGIEAAQQLINVDGAVGIIGALSSGVTIPVAQSVTSDAGIPQISSASTSPVLTTLDDNDFLFRTVPSDAFQGVALAQVVDEGGYGNVSILYINNDYGEGLAESFSAAFEDLGGTVAESLAYEPGSASYRGELSRAATDDSEALLLIGYPENGITILRQSIEGGYFDRFLFTDGMRAPEIIDAIGADRLEGAFGTSPAAMEDSEAAAMFTEAYEGAYGERPPLPFMDTAYDAVYVMALAIQAAGSTDGRAIRDQLRNIANPPGEEILPGQWERAVELLAAGEDIQYTGASGSIIFDEAGDVPGTFAHWAIQDGEIVNLRVFEPAD